MRGKPPIKYEERTLQIFADLSQDTLRRRKRIRPLLEVMQNHEIQYNWGLATCLIGQKNGHTVKLRFLEEIKDFCKSLEIPTPEIPAETTLRKERTTQDEDQ